jgi:hypothetical protein
MRLYEAQIPELTDDIYAALDEAETIEVEPSNVDEVKRDITSVLEEYVRVDNEIADEAHERKIREDNLTFGRAKQEIADEKGIGIGEDAVGYIIEQLIETFFHSNFVEEIFATDREIRKTLAPIIRECMEEEDDEDDEDETEGLGAYTTRTTRNSGGSETSDETDDGDEASEEDAPPEWEEKYEEVMSRLGSDSD